MYNTNQYFLKNLDKIVFFNIFRLAWLIIFGVFVWPIYHFKTDRLDWMNH